MVMDIDIGGGDMGPAAIGGAQAPIDLLAIAALPLGAEGTDIGAGGGFDEQAETDADGDVDQAVAGEVFVQRLGQSGVEAVATLAVRQGEDGGVVGQWRGGGDVLPGIGGALQPGGEARGDDGVGVEQDDVCVAGLGQTAVDGADKAEIGFVM